MDRKSGARSSSSTAANPVSVDVYVEITRSGDEWCAVVSVLTDGEYLYWSTFDLTPGSGAIWRASLGGGDPAELVHSQPDIGRLALDAENIYWISYDSVMKAPKKGGAPVAIAAGQVRPASLAVSLGRAYWITGGGNELGLAGTADGAVMTVGTDGGAPAALATNQKNPSALAVDASYVYWACPVLVEGLVRGEPGVIWRRPL